MTMFYVDATIFVDDYWCSVVDWIVPVIGDEAKACCKLCCTDLPADYLELLGHACEENHLQNMSQCKDIENTGDDCQLQLDVSSEPYGTGWFNVLFHALL